MAIKTSQRGVTLIEMLIVVAIIAIITTVLMFNYSDFSSNVSVRNLSQEVALSIRKAQTYATSVRSIEGTDIVTSKAFDGYGISFNTTETATGELFPTNKRFVLFADIPIGSRDTDATTVGVYSQDSEGTCGSPNSYANECIESFTINSADKIVAICGGSLTYSSDPTQTDCPTDSAVDITFTRPSPNARIRYNQPSIGWVESPYAKIILRSAKGLQRSVTVWNTGQISVQ